MHGLTTLISLLYNAMFKLIKDNKFNLLKVPINDGHGKTLRKVINNYYIPRVSSKTVPKCVRFELHDCCKLGYFIKCI